MLVTFELPEVKSQENLMLKYGETATRGVL